MPEPESDQNHSPSVSPLTANRGAQAADLQEQINQALKDLTEAIEPAWRRGDLTPQKVAAAIAGHRARHPYRHP